MRVVYEAENIIDAHLVKGLLEQQGIPAFVKGEYLTGAIGDLPTMGLVAVCVPESKYPEAETVVRSLDSERARPIADPGWDPEPEPA